MTSNQPEFTVLLDKEDRKNNRGFSLNYELRGAPFYQTGATGVADSVEAVQQAGLVQVPSYFLANGRIHADKGGNQPSDPVWTQWHDGLGERLTLFAKKSYAGVSPGLQVVDIQGAGIFMPRPHEIRTVIEGKNPSRKLKNNAYPVSAEEKDLILGEKQAYRFNGTKVEVVPVTFFPSYGAFKEEAKTPAFKRKLKEMTAVYAVLRSAEEARQNPSGYHSIQTQLTNPDLAIPSGGEEQLRNMLLDKKGNPRFAWENFGSHHDGYTNVDSGRVALLGGRGVGVGCGYGLYDYGGRSVGVAPEALVARAENTYKQPTLEEVVETIRGSLVRIGLQ